jgi:hypothetical protein
MGGTTRCRRLSSTGGTRIDRHLDFDLGDNSLSKSVKMNFGQEVFGRVLLTPIQAACDTIGHVSVPSERGKPSMSPATLMTLFSANQACEIAPGGWGWRRASFLPHELNPFLNDLAQFTVDFSFIKTVAAGTDHTKALSNEHSILIGPFNKFYIP